MKNKNKFLMVIFLAVAASAVGLPARASSQISRGSIVSSDGIVLEHSDRLSTPGVFQPPVEITVVAKTDSTNLRLAYAADQVIFNWERNRDQLRIDGGPADGLHKSGAGSIPIGQYVVIRWVVTPKKQLIYVNNELRFDHSGDYSKISKCVSVFPAEGSVVTVKSIKVQQLVLANK